MGSWYFGYPWSYHPPTPPLICPSYISPSCQPPSYSPLIHTHSCPHSHLIHTPHLFLSTPFLYTTTIVYLLSLYTPTPSIPVYLFLIHTYSYPPSPLNTHPSCPHHPSLIHPSRLLNTPFIVHPSHSPPPIDPLPFCSPSDMFYLIKINHKGRRPSDEIGI